MEKDTKKCEHGNPYYCGLCGRASGKVVKNACQCGVCGASADRLDHMCQCQRNPAKG